MEYLWAIGSYPGNTDIQQFVSVGKQTFAFNHTLEGKLKNKQTYYATVKAVNEADLVGIQTSTGIHLTEFIPNSDELSLKGRIQNKM